MGQVGERKVQEGGFGQVPPAPAPLSPAPAAHHCGFPWKPQCGPEVPSRASSAPAPQGKQRARWPLRLRTSQAQGKPLHETHKEPWAWRGQERGGLCPLKTPQLELAASPAPRSVMCLALNTEGWLRTSPGHRGGGRPCPRVQTRGGSRAPSPVPPGASQPLPVGMGKARIPWRCRQLVARAQPNEERVTHVMSRTSRPCSREQSWESCGDGRILFTCSPGWCEMDTGTARGPAAIPAHQVAAGTGIWEGTGRTPGAESSAPGM